MRIGTSDVVVIGGGVIGTAVAYYLAKAGTSVTVVERRGLGQEASGANVGLVTVFSGHSFEEPDPGPVYELTRASANAYTTLGGEIGVDIEYERDGAWCSPRPRRSSGSSAGPSRAIGVTAFPSNGSTRGCP
jgi:glycine/D-amino acid oxidase-like deaminating enzyme